VYCYARPYHEYLGFSAGLDFESKIMVKEDAPELLREELSKKTWTPKVIALSGVTDCYQPVERKLEITRKCLQVFAEFRNPVAIVTKNHLVTRDLDVLRDLAAHRAVSVTLSIATLDGDLHRVMEPRTSVPARRLAAIETLANAGIPAGVFMAPVIPGLTDHEIPAILKTARDAGARHAGWVMLRLPHGVKDLFAAWIERHHPDRAKKVLNRIREMRGGDLNDPQFGTRMRGEGAFADTVERLFDVTCRKLGMNEEREHLSTASFRRPTTQLELF
jgi:DNA repair photolyase